MQASQQADDKLESRPQPEVDIRAAIAADRGHKQQNAWHHQQKNADELRKEGSSWTDLREPLAHAATSPSGEDGETLNWTAESRSGNSLCESRPWNHSEYKYGVR
jgi:hypothetical protein